MLNLNFLRIFINIVLVFLGAVLIFLAVYLFGWDLLSTYLVGNDIGMAQTAALWFDRYFPNIPQWFPLHGSGVQLTQGVIGAPILTVLVSRILGITIVQSMHLWEFLAIYLTALGIFVFVWVKFKNWTAAILAGIFYPLSNASWAWLTEIGTYAQAISFIFYPPALLTLDLFLSELLGEKKERRTILWFSLAAIFASLTVLTHVLAGAVLLVTIFLYTLLFSLFSQGAKVKNFFLGLLGSFSVVFVAIILSGFWLFPYLHYNIVAARNVVPVWSFEQLPFTTLSALFGFADLESLSQINSMWYVFFSRPVWVLAVLGIILAFWKKEKSMVAASLISLFFVFYVIAPGFTPWLVKPLLIFWREIYIRGLIPVIIFLPVLAAWSCLTLGTKISELILRKHQVSLITSVFVLVIAGLAFLFLKGGPPNKDQASCYQGFGRWWRTEVDYCHFWGKLGRIDLSLNSLGPPYESVTKEIAEKLEISPKTRIDISPRLGHLVAVWSNVSEAPIVPLYWYAMALNWKYLGYQGGVFYSRENVEPREAIPDLASWFGIKYVLLHKSEDSEAIKEGKADAFENFDNPNWEPVLSLPGLNLEAKLFKDYPGLATWTNRPTFLVVGQLNRQAFEQVFRKASSGALPYKEALIVEGRDDGRLDKYTLDELKKFEGLILYGQVYENKEKVDRLLSDYVKSGGRVFIESGWQFTNSEWQTHKSLEVIPLERFEWDKGPAVDVGLDTSEIGGKFAVENFGKFVYYNDTWDVTTAPKEEVKSWGKIVWERNSKPIMVVGKFGEGRVVWSGMNLIGHLQYYQSREEYNFTQTLFDWLLEGKEGKNLNMTFIRPNPDRIEFTLNEGAGNYSSILWRENFYPDWQASIKGKALPIYRAGPNLMLMRLGSIQKGEKIILEFKLSLVAQISRIVSLATLLLLIVFVFAPKTMVFFGNFGKKFLTRFSKTVLGDEEY